MDPAEVHSIDTENWMAKLPEAVHNLPLYSIAIPGTHDSFSYSLTPESAFAPDGALDFLKWCPCVGKLLTYRWCVTESSSCTKQLHDGIRYFDFRIASKMVTKSDFRHSKGKEMVIYEIVHGLYGENVKNILFEIAEFLKFHEKEIVLLDFQWLYKMSTADHHRLISMIHEVFQDMLCPVVGSLNFVSLNWLWKEKRQVFVFYRENECDPVPYIWPRSKIPNPWLNKDSPKELFHGLTENYKKKRDDCFYVTQAILTPRLLTILRNFTEDLSLLAKEANPRLLSWLQDKHAGASGINIVIADFYDIISLNLPQHIINLNYKLLTNQFTA